MHEDVREPGGGVQEGGGEDVEGFAQPEEVAGCGAEEDGGGGEREGRHREVLDGAGEARGYGPGGLEAGEGFGEEVRFAFVEDFFFCYGGHGDVLFFHQVVDLFRGYGEGVVVGALQHEAPAVGVEPVRHGPVRVP